jgi:type I restriction enzyme S subunit
MWSNDAAESIVQAGEILVARSNTPELVGRVAMFNGESPGAVASDLTIRIRPGAEIHGEFLVQYLSALYLSGYWRERAGGASGSMKKITRSQILDEMIPVPRLHEQRTVATRMRERLSILEKGHRAASTQLTELSQLASSLVVQSLQCSQRHNACLGDVLHEIKTGIGNGWSGYPVFGATRSGLARAREQPGKNPERYKPVTPGTVFYNPMRILIGSIAFVDDEERGITSPDYVVLRGKPGVVDSRWFYYWLRSPLGERCIQSLARGAVRERMLFNRLAEGEIALPDFAAQVKASKALALIKPMRAAIQRQIKELDLVPQKLLAQVFDS